MYWWCSSALGKYVRHISYATEQKMDKILGSAVSPQITAKKWVNAAIQIEFILNGL